MHEVLWVTGLVGGVLCLVGHLPSPARQWLPHALATAAMSAMAPGVGDRGLLVAGAAVIGGACLWEMRAGCAFRRAAESVNLAVMALLTAAAAVVGQSHHGGEGEEGLTGLASAGVALWPVLLSLACWGVARAGVVLVRQAWPPRIAARSPGRRALLLGEAGGGLMVTAMAVMLGLP
ncbi:hypothetical protein [Streptomyces aurantiacus]|uniref:Uncharacterized protein n=1 Tax=Streptomyces aurantiacus TaxID=47760 RepID=A0A7G1NRD0_9ACTN|nr:hypothetical protein [Streptomyces aurantiacus]BCL25389.1 hypothetical protein GCM10017557_02480 [Streptomyces aurantiacus]